MAGTPVKRLRKALIDEYGLEPAERTFCDRYRIHSDAVRALQEAYGADNHRSCKKILAKSEVIKYLKLKQQELAKRYDITADVVIRELAYILLSRHRDYYNEDGSVKPIHELSDAADAALAGIDVEDIFAGRGEERQQVGEIKKYRRYNKVETAHLLMKNLGIEHGAGSAVGDRLAELVQVFRQGPVAPAPEVKEDKKGGA